MRQKRVTTQDTSASREGEARAHIMPQPGHAQLPRLSGYTRMPQRHVHPAALIARVHPAVPTS